MTSRCFVIFNFCGLYEQKTSHFFRRKFGSTKTPSKFSDILRLMSNLDGISCLIHNNIPPPWQSLSTLYGVVKPSISNWAVINKLSRFLTTAGANRSNLFLIEFMLSWPIFILFTIFLETSQQGRKFFTGVTNFSWLRFLTFLMYLTRVFIHYFINTCLICNAIVTSEFQTFTIDIFNIIFVISIVTSKINARTFNILAIKIIAFFIRIICLTLMLPSLLLQQWKVSYNNGRFYNNGIFIRKFLPSTINSS